MECCGVDQVVRSELRSLRDEGLKVGIGVGESLEVVVKVSGKCLPMVE